ncbi:BspA family leucine-rich repeat surface protein [Bifidobacterium sp. ESL0769]|uniref:BspA family leucine-rich repeat surface protein n=1 Tax=Bifidobacterium sp. ESL0769 TaxID=2983229 RepID=UPI0023F7FA03|nr:BspA family leucine-rich repeat surface protein [Bifidobacterium sp. ESL0769]WEV67427.1 BspA family leucine-rich repeat surface protein [Bifidobacterium sp. ESL0769]
MSSGASNDPVGPSTQTTSSQAATSQTASATSASVSSTIQTSASSASSATTSSISASSTVTTTAPSASASTTSAGTAQASNGQTGNVAADQTQNTVNAQASNQPAQPSHTNQTQNSNQTINTKEGKRAKGKNTTHTNSTGLTHTNAAGTSITKPRTLSTFARKDFADAPKTLGNFLQRLKQPSRHSINKRQAKSAGSTGFQSSTARTLRIATATLPVGPGPVGGRAVSPLARSGSSVGVQDDPDMVVGPQGYGQISVSSWSVGANGVVTASGVASDYYGQAIFPHIRVCPVGVSPGTSGTNNVPSQCSDSEMMTEGHVGGATGDNIHWSGVYTSFGGHGPNGSDFVNDAGYYNFYAYTQTWGDSHTSDMVNFESYYYYVGARRVTYAYVSINANGGSAAYPSSLSTDTTDGSGSFDLTASTRLSANKPGCVFTGWATTSSGSGSTWSPGSGTAYVPQHDTRSVTLYAQWRAVPAATVNAPSVSVSAPQSSSPTVSVSVSTSGLGGYSGSTVLSTAYGSRSCSSPSSCWVSGWPVSTFQPTMGATYSLSVSVTVQDPYTGHGVSVTTSWASGASGTGTLPWMSVSYDKNGATGSAPASSSALVDAASGKAYFTLPDGTGMTAPARKFFHNWTTAPDGTGSAFPSGAQAVPTSAGTTTDAHTTVTLYAVWGDPPAPTGVSAWYSHADSRIYLDVTGLDPNATGWVIQVKPTGTEYWEYTQSLPTRGRSYCSTLSYFTVGATWQARAQALYGDGISSVWSDTSSGVLPYMDVTLLPGGQQPGDTAVAHAKGLVDQTERKGYVTVPEGVGATPAGTVFQSIGGWTTRADGSGVAYNSGDIAIPTNVGTANGNAVLLTLYARWQMSTSAPARGRACTSVSGWQQWGTSAGAIAGVGDTAHPQDTGAVCWAIEGSTLRLTGGTGPLDFSYSNSRIPWWGRRASIAHVSIEGDLTLISRSTNYGAFQGMTALTSLDNGNHAIHLAKQAGGRMFSDDTSLAGLDLSNWRTDTATSLSQMFYNCDKLGELKGISGWQTGQVTELDYMFYENKRLTMLDLSRWDTSNVERMDSVFLWCDRLVDLDISGWDTSGVYQADYSNLASMLPNNLKRLRLGPKTILFNRYIVGQSGNPFMGFDSTHTWHQWDWPAGHHPIDNGAVTDPTGTATAGTLDALEARAASATPAGTYIRDDVNPTWTDLKYDLNGATGDTSLPTAVSTTDSAGLAIDTTFADGSYTIPDDAATHITANKIHSLFQGWRYDTSGVASGTPVVSNHTITAPKGTGGVATVDASWNALEGEASATVGKVSVATNTADKGTVTVNVAAVLPVSSGNLKACVKPGNQTDDYASNQCQSVASSASGQQIASVPAFTLPGSLAANQSTTFPAPGSAYTMAAMYTVKDPATDNDVDSEATEAGGGITAGVLPYVRTLFDVDAAHGGQGTPPANMLALVDSTSGKAWPTLPLPTATMTPDHAAFRGWATSKGATGPDTGMGDPANRAITVNQHDDDTETDLSLYAVWRRPATPVVDSVERHVDNTVTLSGTVVPQSDTDTMLVRLAALDGQEGPALGVPFLAAISPTDASSGATLPYDGAAAHPWTLTMQATDLPQGGRYQVVAVLNMGEDGAWHGVTTPRVVTSPDPDPVPAVHLQEPYAHALPLTGGQRTMLIIALALLGVFLIGMSQLARNRRRWHHQ